MDKINSEQFCLKANLCSISVNGTCSACVESLQLRKDGLLLIVNRVMKYFNNFCQQYAKNQCHMYVKQIHDSIQTYMKEFDLKETCTSIGFCSTDNSKNDIDFNQYEYYLENLIDRSICSRLGLFETLCKKLVRGDLQQIQEVKINIYIQDLVQIQENLTDALSTTDDVGKFIFH